jgi:hypothetical protein
METKDPTNQIPEQENTPEKEENVANAVNENQKIEEPTTSDEKLQDVENEAQDAEPDKESTSDDLTQELLAQTNEVEPSPEKPEELIPEAVDKATESTTLPEEKQVESDIPEVLKEKSVETETPENLKKMSDEPEDSENSEAEAISEIPVMQDEKVEEKEESAAEILEEPKEEDVEIIPGTVPKPEIQKADEVSDTLTEEPPVEEAGKIADAAMETIDEEMEAIGSDNKEISPETEEAVVTSSSEMEAIGSDEKKSSQETIEDVTASSVAVEETGSQEEVEIVSQKEEPESTEGSAEVSEEEPVKVAAEDAEQKDDDEEDDEVDEEESEEIYQNLSRDELVDLMEATVQEQDVQAIKVKVALIKVAYLQKEKEEEQSQYDLFVKQGGVPEDYSPEADQLSERFQMAFNVYREKKQQYNEELEKEKFTNLEAKKRILEELKALISSEETLKKTYDDFKTLQDQWKQIGMVPKNEVNQLWQNYHFLVEKFFDKVKINKELKDLDLKKNLERKIELCEKAEELLLETSIIKSFKQLQQYHEEWKEIGPAPQDKRDEIWERFKIASDQINDRRREYYSKKQTELESNYLAKSALCENAEKLISTTPETLRQWQNRTSEINDLLRVWKTIGLAPKKVNNEIWVRFKTCLDSHFTSYKEFLSRMKDYQLNNYNLKLDLCAQAEAIKNSTDWRNTTQELIQLQREWKSIGPVPRKHSDKIWKRFRTACDEFFQRKSEYFSNLADVEQANMQKKEELIKKLEDFEFSDNRSQNLETLKNFQREWLEIGHVPIREKDRLQNAFRSVLNKHFGKLKIDASEVNALHYKNRLETIKDKPDAGRMLSRERNSLQIGINKLQEDILLWENNIGFLAESKNANIVKVEFQKKIDKAKQELALMEAKLRYLRDI